MALAVGARQALEGRAGVVVPENLEAQVLTVDVAGPGQAGGGR